MNPSEQSEEVLFEHCLELPPEEWESFLERTCPNDESLRSSVLSLLRTHEKEGGFLDSLSDGDSSTERTNEQWLAKSRDRVVERKQTESLWLMGLVVVMVVGVVVASGLFLLQSRNTLPRIGVLPFEVLSSEEGALLSGEALQQEMIQRFSDEAVVTAVPLDEMPGQDSKRQTAWAGFTGDDFDYWLMGILQTYGDQASIHVQLVNPDNFQNVLSREYRRTVLDGNEGSILKELSLRVKAEVESFVASGKHLPQLETQSFNPEAQQLYEQGMEIVDTELETFLSDAISLFNQAIELDPNFVDAYLGLGWAYLLYEDPGQLGISSEKSLSLMRLAAENALEIDGELAEAHVLLGAFRLNKGDRRRSKEHFDKALELDPDSANAYFCLAQLEVTEQIPVSDPRYAESMDRVVQYLQTAVELEPGVARFHYELGFTLGYLGRFEETETYFQQCLEINPRYAKAWAGLASIAIYNQGNYVEAMVHLRKALALDPANREYGTDIRNIYEVLGAKDPAINWSRALGFQHQKFAELYDADVLFLEGDRASAREMYEDLIMDTEDLAVFERTRRRLLDYDLRNDGLKDAKSLYFLMAPNLFAEDLGALFHEHALGALELAPILLRLGNNEQAARLGRAGWDYFQHIPKNDPYRPFYRCVSWISQGDLDEASKAFRRAVDQGFRMAPEIFDARLDVLHENPDYEAARQIVEADFKKQLESIRQLEDEGKLEPIPEIYSLNE